MTKVLIKLAPAIANIDGGCSNCIISFLGRSYMIQPFDLVVVVKTINEHLYTPLLISEVQECIDNLEWRRDNPDL